MPLEEDFIKVTRQVISYAEQEDSITTRKDEERIRPVWESFWLFEQEHTHYGLKMGLCEKDTTLSSVYVQHNIYWIPP